MILSWMSIPRRGVTLGVAALFCRAITLRGPGAIHAAQAAPAPRGAFRRVVEQQYAAIVTTAMQSLPITIAHQPQCRERNRKEHGVGAGLRLVDWLDSAAGGQHQGVDART